MKARLPFRTTVRSSVLTLLGTLSFGALDAIAAAPTIPLCPGLQIVTALSQSNGDYESIKTIQTVSDTEVRLHYSAEVNAADMFSDGPELKKFEMNRIVLVQDLQSATDYQQAYLTDSDEKIPGTTSIGTSAALLQNLKTKGKSDFGYSNAYGGLTLSSDKSKSPNYYSYLQRGTLERIPGPATLPVLVNDVLVDLPVVRAQADVYGDKVEFSWLDDPANPLTLAFRIGIGGIKPLTPEQAEYCAALLKNTGEAQGYIPGVGVHCDKPNGADRDTLRVIKIAFKCGGAPPPGGGGGGNPLGAGVGLGNPKLGDPKLGDGGSGLEKALANQQKVDIYSIYFSYNSDALRDESTPTLKEIADIMTRHPDWRLAVNGHTDGIGGDQFNADLSRRRAAAVVNALVTQYHIGTGRLKSAGFGKSQPKDTNDTLEGRARNRRVELTRF
jgi:outer membrane protein OmpA-like peptidoglycan-associated protein